MATYKRAATEAALLPRAELILDVPPDAVVRVDGVRSPPAAALTLGQHFVSVAADGYERWAAVISVAGAPTRFKPPIHLHRPPPIDKLVALAGRPEPHHLLVGALEKVPAGWSFTVRDITLSDGRSVSDSVTLGDVPTRAAVAGLVHRVRPPRRRNAPAVDAVDHRRVRRGADRVRDRDRGHARDAAERQRRVGIVALSVRRSSATLICAIASWPLRRWRGAVTTRSSCSRFGFRPTIRVCSRRSPS